MKLTLSSPLGDRRVTLEQLRAFALIAEGGGFQQAAQELCRSQSAITQGLKRLEEILECRLVERRQGHVVGLTPDGERFLPAANEILARASEAVSAMKRPQIAGHLAIGVPDDFKIFDLHGAMSRCLAMNPDLRIEVRSALSSTIFQMLDAGHLDLAIAKRVATDDLSDEGRTIHLLRKEPLHWIASERQTIDRFEELPLTVFPEGCSYRAAARAALSVVGKRTYCSYVSAAYENIRAAVSSGLGVGILPQSALSKDHVILDEGDGFPPLPDVHLVMIQASKAIAIRQMADFLRRSSGNKIGHNSALI